MGRTQRSWLSIVATISLLSALLAVFTVPADAYPRPGITERVSVASDGAEANDASFIPAISADGRYVAFQSKASNLVPGDTNGARDVFVHDRETGATERVSVASDGTEANADSGLPAISTDRRYVAFFSLASNLVPGDTNGRTDIFVHDRETGSTERVSVASDGAQANAASYYTPAISADGRYVAFESKASNLVPGDTNGASDVFVHDRETGATERVSVAPDGTEADGGSLTSAISADGRYVALFSFASNLVPGDTNLAWDVFVHDRETGTTERVSVASDGTEANAASYPGTPAISADGRHVAFTSDASNLVPVDTNGDTDVFVHDRTTGATERVSVASDGTEANRFSEYAVISADGRYVAFESVASNLVPGDTNGASGAVGGFGRDIFVHDRATGAIERISVASDRTETNSASYLPATSADGRYVAFMSYASNLVPGDTNGASDVFVHERGDVDILSVLKVPGGVRVVGRATFSEATLAGATDPDDDGTGVIGAAVVGAELTGAALIYRPGPEQEDLLLRLDLSSLPSDPPVPAPPPISSPPRAGAGLPGVLYGADLRVGETRYEVRALRAAATADPPRAPLYGPLPVRPRLHRARPSHGLVRDHRGPGPGIGAPLGP